MATKLINGQAIPVWAAARYEKQMPAFSDAIALVRRCLWSNCHRETPKKVGLYYRVRRKNYGDQEAPLWITLEERDSQWQVTGVEPWY